MNGSLQDMTWAELNALLKGAQLAIGRAKLDRKAAIKRSAAAKIKLYKLNLEVHRRKTLGEDRDDEQDRQIAEDRSRSRRARLALRQSGDCHGQG